MASLSPIISVLMGVYNGEEHVREAVNSILKQTFTDFEFLIVNDGSTDQTQAILEQIAKEDTRIRILANKMNIGLTRSLNRASQQAQGLYIARMDADDVAMSDRFQKQIDILEANHHMGIIGTAYHFIDKDGQLIGKKIPLVEDTKLRQNLIRSNPFLHSSVVIRSDLFKQVGGYNEHYYRAQDYDLWMRCAPLCTLANLPDVLMQKRFTTNMISFARERDQIRSAIRIRSAAIQRKQYPWWCTLFLIKPFLATILPSSLVRFIRVHLFGQKMYAKINT